MRYAVEVQYTAHAKFIVGARNMKEARDIACDCHEATCVGQALQITSACATPIPTETSVEADGDVETTAALELAEEIQLCPDCGQNVAEYGADEDCVEPEGCGALNGSAAISYELAKLALRLRSVVDAIASGHYSDARVAISDAALTIVEFTRWNNERNPEEQAG